MGGESFLAFLTKIVYIICRQ